MRFLPPISVIRSAILIVLVLTGVFATAVVWEFAIEPVLNDAMLETAVERWRYVMTATAFAAIAVSILALFKYQVSSALRESEKRLAKAQRLAHLGNWGRDFRTGSLEWSDEVFRIFGHKPKSFKPLPDDFYDQIHAEDRDKVKQSLIAASETGAPHSIDHRIVRPDGTIRWVHEEGEVEFDEAHNQVRTFGTVQDITERKQLEEQLRQANKMEALGQLTGGVAHDLNNTLAVILGNLELLAERVGDDVVGQGYATRAQVSIQRGATLIEQLLSFSRKQALAPRVIDAGEFVRSMTDMLRRTLEESVEIEMVIGEDLWHCLADPGQLENALLNLAINSRDAMAGTGKLTIEITNADLDDGYAAAQAEVAPGQYILIAVSDTGAGIPSDLIGQVFDPFFTTKEVGKGSGLGLSMVYGFAKQSGGHLSVYSELGEGTTVKLFLPRSDLSAPSQVVPDQDPQITEVPKARGETILVVEDEGDVRTLVVALLSGIGYEILEAGNAESALTALETSSRINMVLTDVILAGEMNGPDLAREISRRRPGIGILYMSGYAENAIANYAGIDEGAELLTKPFKRADLAQKVRAVLDRANS